MSAPYTLIVNTSDSYSDCWIPFFKLLDKYWPDLHARVILNTELATFAGSTVHQVESSRVQDDVGRRLTWGECLLRCLDTVQTPLVMYMQEDYFLEAPVDGATVNALAARMLGEPKICNIGLTAFGAYGPFALTEDPRLWKVDARSRYRTSLQAGFWRTETLRSYLRPEENGWMFEIYGSRRSWRRDEDFLVLNRDREREKRVLPYSLAGIVKGQWWSSVPELFKREGIEMDFSQRGFFRPRPAALEKLRTLQKLMEHPKELARGILGL